MPVFLTEDGSHSFLSEQFDVLYHSSHGAIQETQHIYIDAGLKHLAQTADEITVLDMGFGTGLNAFMTYIEAQRLCLKIRYITYEKYPLSKEAVAMLNFDTELKVSKEILNVMHHCSWHEQYKLAENFIFEKRLTAFEDLDLHNEIDLIYYDAFAPEIQPQLWEQPMMQKMYDALHSKGILTTYCAKGVFKRTLKSVGFHVEGLPGPPFKREITRAVKA